MTSTHSVASVTVATNAAHLLPRQLDALKRQSRKLDEIVVVDNASTDDTVDMLASQYPEVKVLRLPENGGVGGDMPRDLPMPRSAGNTAGLGSSTTTVYRPLMLFKNFLRACSIWTKV